MSAIPTAENPITLPSATMRAAMSEFDEMAGVMAPIVESSEYLADESATLAFATRFAHWLATRFARGLTAPLSIALHGDLGAGKTTFVRGVLRALGVSGAIKSPTYALVETYDTPLGDVVHMDAYRIEGRDDFEARGGMEYFSTPSIRLVEWPEKIDGMVRFDVDVRIDFDGEGRRISVTAATKDRP